jgi:hypothetical protein
LPSANSIEPPDLNGLGLGARRHGCSCIVVKLACALGKLIADNGDTLIGALGINIELTIAKELIASCF